MNNIFNIAYKTIFTGVFRQTRPMQQINISRYNINVFNKALLRVGNVINTVVIFKYIFQYFNLSIITIRLTVKQRGAHKTTARSAILHRYVVSCPLGMLSTTMQPCTPYASHADQTQAYIMMSPRALSRYRDPTNFHDSSPNRMLSLGPPRVA